VRPFLNTFAVVACSVVAFTPVNAQRPAGDAGVSDAQACQALGDLANVTITTAIVKPAAGGAPEHCYVRGTIAGGRIRFHMQLPLRASWNNRLLNIGDGGKDGGLEFANERVGQGYAVANSNTGHDSGSEPAASFGTNLESVIDFGHRAIHLTAIASKTIVRAFYGRAAQYSYFEGCSTGGRQGLMEAQRYPDDFDGIVAGAPVFDYQAVNITHVWLAKKVLEDRAAANMAFDKDGDGVPESLTKYDALRQAVLAKCDAKDGITDGLVDDPLACEFKPDVDLAPRLCKDDVNGDDCFTSRQIKLIADFYRGPYDSRGRSIRKGFPVGSEFDWLETRIAAKSNNMTPGNLYYAVDHFNYLFYRESPGAPVPVVNDLSYVPDKKATPPEFAWWEFNVDDLAGGKGAFMSAILEARDPNLTRFLKRSNGKLLLYHGWGDTTVSAEPTLDYYKAAVTATFGGDLAAAREKMRIFMVPGMGHCFGGIGCDVWDRLAPLVEWVENGKAPDYLVGAHVTNGAVDNQRKICAYPQKAVYVGPAGGQHDRANWTEGNFACHP
jgi:feruloyl esterase